MELNTNLKKTLSIALPYNGREDLMASMERESPDLLGLTSHEFYEYLQELVDMGFARVEGNASEDDFMVIFASEATSYFKDSRLEVFKTIGRYCFQLLIGTSGGLLALFLSKFI